ncbi:MAG: pseudaminic acid synthase [Thermodesulfobacteriota bacterium]
MGFKIGDRQVGGPAPALLVAELSANHGHDIGIAIRTIEAARDAGADAVKVQTYTPDTMTIDCGDEPFRIGHGTLWDGRTLYELYAEAHMPWQWQPRLKKTAEELGLLFFSSPFDRSSADFLESIGTPAYKIASFEITDTPLIEYVAGKGKPVIISTGIAGRHDIEEALAACRRAGNDRIALLKCTSAYPAPLKEMNLLTMPDMARRFDVVVGLSDHGASPSVPVASVALGAKIIEKHFIMDRSIGGPDASFSLDPGEFKAMARGVREAEEALGEVTYEMSEAVMRHRRFSRSLFAVKDISKGEPFTEENVRSIRPGDGLHPGRMKDLLGRKAAREIKRGEPMSMEMAE